jgi:hypothetical protein
MLSGKHIHLVVPNRLWDPKTGAHRQLAATRQSTSLSARASGDLEQLRQIQHREVLGRMVLKLKYHRGGRERLLECPIGTLVGPIVRRLGQPDQFTARETISKIDDGQKLTVTPRPDVAHESSAPYAGLVESPNLPLGKSSQPAAFVESAIGFSFSVSTGVVGRSTR